jgi:hypothetical protein
MPLNGSLLCPQPDNIRMNHQGMNWSTNAAHAGMYAMHGRVRFTLLIDAIQPGPGTNSPGIHSIQLSFDSSIPYVTY